MKTTITPILTVAMLLFLFAGLMPLRAQSQEQVERFRKEREAFFTERLDLTPQELRAFWDVYDDLYNRKMKLAEDERNAFSYAHQNADHLTDAEAAELLDKIGKLKVEQIQLENDYYQNKFTEVLPAKKVIKLYQVDFDFRRYLLRRLRETQREESDGGDRRNGGRPDDGMHPFYPLPIPGI